MELVCSDCGRTYPTDGPWRCDCGHPLEFADRPVPDDGPPATLDRDDGLWAFSDLLSVERRVSLGEGWTPLVEDDEWGVQFKLESIFPTGSFKDRGATTTISRALGQGVDRVVEDSSGNAGLAIATYAARAGLDAEIFVPADAKPGKLRAIERTGATLRRIEGTRQDVTDACIDAVESGVTGRSEGTPNERAGSARSHGELESSERGGTTRESAATREPDVAYYASHAWDPAFFAGTATVAFEIAAQRGWSAPDAFVTPLGHGTLFLGAYRGFHALQAAGWIDSMPRLLGAQAAGVAPIVEALGGDPSPGTGERNDAADGIQIAEPARKAQIVEAIEATGGDAVAVTAEATDREHDRLARAGFHVEPTCATATSALDRFRDRGAIDDRDDVVVALTGSGLKTS
ncbi:pyridoxal-phosphate dependent enzyme [Halapricum hydrolyticum]|uniref:Pyridoxal-phosphate dependent enzyme n=1 Tax=Halapricum hydrolyticum TaxID=2979991 RepID=A0AAE3LEK3_9EURY|nr:pyridoxal-phosphate dependent enzyme [Halapricum hydrolyticum]MCU4718421.1 pyridoxal-phosphate dependent enzyme [Halapricum hydrolyticum]MCU4726466.1 pyridoxal-phosphate dependent enzyme [Halapricum hydrolyticum]